MTTTRTTPLIDSLAIAHLDFQPVCQIQVQQECQNPADFLIVTHGCYVIEALDPREVDVLVCDGHLDRCKRTWDSWPHRPFGCFYCGKVFSTYSDLVSKIVPL